MGLTKLIDKALIIFVGVFLILFLLSLLIILPLSMIQQATGTYQTLRVDCYDRWDNKIVGERCIKKIICGGTFSFMEDTRCKYD